jgi:hypothetical protein
VNVGSTSVSVAERDQRRQPRGRALEAERLLAVTDAAGDHAQTDRAVGDDHDRREDRVARQRRRLGAAGEHHREDQRDLDHRHREREDERSERLADAVRDDLGVVDRCDDRRDQRRHREPDEQRAERKQERGSDDGDRGERRDDAPAVTHRDQCSAEASVSPNSAIGASNGCASSVMQK